MAALVRRATPTKNVCAPRTLAGRQESIDWLCCNRTRTAWGAGMVRSQTHGSAQARPHQDDSPVDGPPQTAHRHFKVTSSECGPCPFASQGGSAAPRPPARVERAGSRPLTDGCGRSLVQRRLLCEGRHIWDLPQVHRLRCLFLGHSGAGHWGCWGCGMCGYRGGEAQPGDLVTPHLAVAKPRQPGFRDGSSTAACRRHLGPFLQQLAQQEE